MRSVRVHLLAALRIGFLLGASGCTPVEWGCLLAGAERTDDVDHAEHDIQVTVLAPTPGTQITSPVTFQVVVDDRADTPAVDLTAFVYFEDESAPLSHATGPRGQPLTLVCDLPDHASGELVFDVVGYLPWQSGQNGVGSDSERVRLHYRAPWVAELAVCGTLECVRPAPCRLAGEVVFAASAHRDKDRMARAVFSIDGVMIADRAAPPFRTTWDSAGAAGTIVDVGLEVHDLDGRVSTTDLTCAVEP